MDPENDTIPDDVLNPDTPAATAEESSLDEALAESLDRAIEDEPEPATAAVETRNPTPKVEGESAPEASAGGKSEAKKTEGEPAPEGKKPDPAAVPDAEAEAEITALGLKEKAAARFRELTTELKALAPIRQQLEQAGVKDVGELPQLVKRAQDGEYLISSIEQTGVTPDDFTRLLDYGAMIAAGRSGDRAAVERAFEEVGREYAAIAKALGKEIPGVYDPLEEHADLRQAVENGDMDRKHAAELAAARERNRAVEQHHQQQREQASHSQRAEAAQQQALSQIVQFDQQMAQDPTYAAKRPMLDVMVRNIRATLPPAQWFAATQQAYASIPDVATPPQPQSATPAPSAVRPGGPRGSMAPKKFESVEDALDFALDGPASR